MKNLNDIKIGDRVQRVQDTRQGTVKELPNEKNGKIGKYFIEWDGNRNSWVKTETIFLIN